MNKYFTRIAAGLITGTALMLTAAPALATSIDINIGVQPRPVYVQPQYEVDWRERQVRAAEWRANPKNHGHAVSAAAHARHDARKNKHKKHHHKNKHDH